MTLSENIVQHNRNGAHEIIMRNGFERPENDFQAVNAINHLLQTKREPFLMELADHHPDYKLIETRVLQKQALEKPSVVPVVEKMSNATADEHPEHMSNATASELRAIFEKEKALADETTNNATGDEKSTPLKAQFKFNPTEWVLVGTACVIAVIIVWKSFK